MKQLRVAFQIRRVGDHERLSQIAHGYSEES
jgi:hypothetical protein